MKYYYRLRPGMAFSDDEEHLYNRREIREMFEVTPATPDMAEKQKSPDCEWFPVFGIFDPRNLNNLRYDIPVECDNIEACYEYIYMAENVMAMRGF